MKALYACLRLGCGHVWEGDPGPTDCTKCGHHYVKWVNYEESGQIKKG